MVHFKTLLLKAYRRATHPFRRSPDIFILGFQKCGTTSLYRYLENSGAVPKGIHKENNVLAHTPRGLLAFMSFYPVSWKVGRNQKIACGSHLMGSSPHALDVMTRYFPNAQVLFILRNPADRAISRYLDNQRKPVKEDNDDHKFKRTMLEQIEYEMTHVLTDHDLSVSELYDLDTKETKFGGLLAKGHYHVFIKQFVTFNPKVVFLEELSNDFKSQFSDVMNHLEIDSFEMPKSEIFNASKNESLHLTERGLLNGYYSVSNKKLEELLGKKLPSSWY